MRNWKREHLFLGRSFLTTMFGVVVASIGPCAIKPCVRMTCRYSHAPRHSGQIRLLLALDQLRKTHDDHSVTRLFSRSQKVFCSSSGSTISGHSLKRASLLRLLDFKLLFSRQAQQSVLRPA